MLLLLLLRQRKLLSLSHLVRVLRCHWVLLLGHGVREGLPPLDRSLDLPWDLPWYVPLLQLLLVVELQEVVLVLEVQGVVRTLWSELRRGQGWVRRGAVSGQRLT